MSLINDEFIENKVENLFKDFILPLHAQGEKYFGEETTDAETYFGQPKHPEFTYISTIPLQNEEVLVKYLKKVWKEEPFSAEFIEKLVAFAFELRELEREENTDISPFIYVMF
jgi:hypothetical protein